MGSCRIICESSEPFFDRRQAGELLSGELESFGGRDVVVLGIPRGGVVIAERIARRLDCALDVIICRKLGAPGNPELAEGAVSESGRLFLEERVVSQTNAGEEYLEAEKNRQMKRIKARVSDYRVVLEKVSLEGKTVIITDDGVATGSTMEAAIWAVRGEGAVQVAVALPVAPPESIRKLSKDADTVLCLRAPHIFYSISQFYLSFSQVSDKEVIDILRREAKRRLF